MRGAEMGQPGALFLSGESCCCKHMWCRWDIFTAWAPSLTPGYNPSFMPGLENVARVGPGAWQQNAAGWETPPQVVFGNPQLCSACRQLCVSVFLCLSWRVNIRMSNVCICWAVCMYSGRVRPCVPYVCVLAARGVFSLRNVGVWEVCLNGDVR